MEENLLNMNHLKKMILSFRRDILKYNLSIYIFGSYLYKKNSNDIDILVLYSLKNQDILEFIKFKNTFKSNIEKMMGKKVDLIILTYEEDNEIKFKELEEATELVNYKFYC